MTDPAPILRDLVPGDAGWVIGRHGALYARDEGFGPEFEALVAEILATFLRRADPLRERGCIAEGADGQRLGCIFCMAEGPEAPGIARLRPFLLEPEARGTGLAARLLAACTDFARAAGYGTLRLSTHESHRAAGRLYARSGFTLTGSQPVRSFGCDLVAQHWEKPLRDD